MKKYLFKQAHYLQSTLEEIPPFLDPQAKPLPEIAFVGRSNVGKSSLINHLFNRKNLAKVSMKPGKTQTINYFNVDDQLILVDLPGYGYAARAQQMQMKWSSAIDTYIQKRSCLALILLLMDSRRRPSEEDIAFFQWAHHHKKPLLIIFTKSDTLNSHEKKAHLANICEILPIENHLYYSIKDGRTRQELIGTISQFLNLQP